MNSLGLQSESSGREPENGKIPKVVRRGCKRSFEPKGAKVSQESFAPSETRFAPSETRFAPVQPHFAPVQPHFAPVQPHFRSLGSKDLLHPLLTTLGSLPELSGCNPWTAPLLWCHNLLFLALLDFLAFFFCKELLAFLIVFHFFPRDFRVRRRENILGASGLKIGAPQKRQIQPRRIQPPILGPLITSIF